MPEHRSILTPDQLHTRRGTRITALRGWRCGCPIRTQDAAALNIIRQRPRPSISEAPRLTHTDVHHGYGRSRTSVLTSGAFAGSPEEALDCACLPTASGVPSPRRKVAGMMTSTV